MGTLVQLTGAAWPAAAPACVRRLHAVAVRPVVLVSNKKHIRGMYARCAIQINDLYLFLPFILSCVYKTTFIQHVHQFLQSF